MVDATAIRRCLQAIGQGLSDGDAKAVAGLWELPGVLLTDQGTKIVASRQEVEDFFASAIAWYRQQGTPGVRGELLRTDALTDRLVAVDVSWLTLDEAGATVAKETSHYILHMGDDGVARVQVALSRTQPLR